MKDKNKPYTDDIDPSFYPEIIEALNQAEEDRKRGINYFTLEEVNLMLSETIRRAENKQLQYQN